jgi:hypothetical protein
MFLCRNVVYRFDHFHHSFVSSTASSSLSLGLPDKRFVFGTQNTFVGRIVNRIMVSSVSRNDFEGLHYSFR